ncbi:MAG: SRPBCC domain-containing protein [Deltaproteobacteria bacterium]|nr:SRPBCC domain-containing protein [Deltaproteobacteria bacterium]
MAWLKRVSVVLAAAVVLIVVVPWVIGALMDREHVGQGAAVVAAPIEEVWTTVSAFDKTSQWAPDFESVRRASDVKGLPSYEVSGDGYSLTFTFTEVVPPERLVAKLEDHAQNYGGEWTYELSTVAGGTRIAITERGWTEPAYFRFMLWLFGYDTTIEGYLDGLQKKYGGERASSTAS